MDLATAYYNGGEVYVLYGDGSGAFASAGFYSTFGSSYGFALCDMNKDGLVDIVSVNWNNSYGTNGNVSVLVQKRCGG